MLDDSVSCRDGLARGRPAPGHAARHQPDAVGRAESPVRAPAGARSARPAARHDPQLGDAADAGHQGTASRGLARRQRRRPARAVSRRRRRHRTRGRERQARHRAAGEPRADVPESGRTARSGQAGHQLHLRADRAQPQGGRRAVGRSALQARPRLRRSGPVSARRGRDGRPGAQGGAAGRRRASAADRGEHPPARGTARALRLLAHHRQQRPDAAGLRADRAGGPDQHDGAHPRRVGHRQGAHRARDSLQLAALDQAVRQGQLRGAARLAHRIRAVRLREGRVHGRPGAQEGPLRAGRGRHAVSGRDRRRAPVHAGQAAARAAGAGVRAARRHRGGQGERPADRGDEQGPREGDRRGHASARICTTG